MTHNEDTSQNSAFAALLDVCGSFRFEPHDIAHQLDQTQRYHLPMDKEFPLRVMLFHFGTGQFTSTGNWHERLEMTMPLDGPLCMRMGDVRVNLAAGDLLLVDNLKLHSVENSAALSTRVVVVTFMPEFIHSPGSPACDYIFLLPFYAKREDHPHVLRAADPLAPSAYTAMSELLKRYSRIDESLYFQAGCKASALRLLYVLALRFHASAMLRAEFEQHRRQSDLLSRVFEYVQQHYSERITVTQASQLVRMSQARFMKTFKRVSGSTFVAYVNRVRIANAMRLLRETDLTIADVATKVGFADQSYFDRRFKQETGASPQKWRQRLLAERAPRAFRVD